MLTEVDHVTNYLKERSIDRLIDNRNNSPFESKAMGFKMFCKIPLTKSKASKTEMFILQIGKLRLEYDCLIDAEKLLREIGQ